MKALLERVEAIDLLQAELETLGVDLISHPQMETEKYQVKIALAYSTLQRALRTPAPEPAVEAPPAQFNELEEKLGEEPSEPTHEASPS